MGWGWLPPKGYGSSKDVWLEVLATSPSSQVVTWRQLCPSEMQLSYKNFHRTFLFRWQTNCAWSSGSAINYRDRHNASDAGYNEQKTCAAKVRLATAGHLQEECRSREPSSSEDGNVLPCWLRLHAASKDSPCPLKADDSLREQFYWLLPFTYTLSSRSPQGSPRFSVLILESHLACKTPCCIRKSCFRHSYVCSPSDTFSETWDKKYWMHGAFRGWINFLL